MSAESAVAAGRAAAAARRRSTCNVRRKTGASTIAGGFKVPTWSTIYPDEPVRIGGANAGSAQSRRITAGDFNLNVSVRVASFDTARALRDGDHLEMTSGDTDNLVWRVVEADPKDDATALRVTVVATTRPEEWT